jgi:ribokinase
VATVWVVGSINVDLVVRVRTLPRPGETIHGIGLTRSQGGKGANQAIAAARLGATCRLLGRVGTDPDGAWLCGELVRLGVDRGTIVRGDGPSGTAVVLVDDAGENSIVVVAAANGELHRDDLGAFRPARDDVVVVQNEVPIETTGAAIEVGLAAAATTIFNPAPATAACRELARTADVVIVNETELAILAGVDVDAASATEDIVAAADRVRADRPVVVTLGARGVVATIDGEVVEVPSLAGEVVDTTGAGDAFVGAIAARLAEGASLRDALDDAIVVASIVVGRPGAGPAMPTAEEVASVIDARRRP